MSELTKSKYELASFCNEMEWLQQIARVLRLKEELLFTNKSIDFLVLGTLQQAPQHQRVISDGYSTRRSLVSTFCKNNVSKSGRNCWKVDLHETKGASSVQNATRTAKTESSIDFADSVELDGLTSARTNLVLFLSLSRSLFHAPFLAQLCRWQR